MDERWTSSKEASKDENQSHSNSSKSKCKNHVDHRGSVAFVAFGRKEQSDLGDTKAADL